MTEQTVNNTRLAFVDISVYEDGSIRGGILVTDLETRPIEFRVTSPVKPTSLQRILYGQSLVEYVYGELICLPLIKAAKEKLNLIIVKNENIMIIRPKITMPMVFIKNDGKNSTVEGGKLREVVYKPHKNFPGEQDWARAQLTDLAQKHDVLEPFERLKTAMAEVHKQRIEEKVRA